MHRQQDSGCTCHLPGHICVLKALGDQGLTGESVALTVAFQALSCQSRLSWEGCFSTSVTLALHGTSDLIQFSPLVLQKKSPQARGFKAAHLSGAELWHPGPLAPCPHRSWPLSRASLPACWTSPHPTASHRDPQGTRQETWPRATSGAGGTQGSFPAPWLNPAPGRTRLAEGSRAGQSGRDGVPSRSPRRNLPPDS